MAAEESAVWCGNAYQDEVPAELESIPSCDSVGTVIVIDPSGGWSGFYCSDCSKVLLAAGWIDTAEA